MLCLSCLQALHLASAQARCSSPGLDLRCCGELYRHPAPHRAHAFQVASRTQVRLALNAVAPRDSELELGLTADNKAICYAIRHATKTQRIEIMPRVSVVTLAVRKGSPTQLSTGYPHVARTCYAKRPAVGLDRRAAGHSRMPR